MCKVSIYVLDSIYYSAYIELHEAKFRSTFMQANTKRMSFFENGWFVAASISIFIVDCCCCCCCCMTITTPSARNAQQFGMCDATMWTIFSQTVRPSLNYTRYVLAHIVHVCGGSIFLFHFISILWLMLLLCKEIAYFCEVKARELLNANAYMCPGNIIP